MASARLAKALFEPQNIALIGASDDKGRNNSRPQQFLKKHGYKGKIYPINPRRKKVMKSLIVGLLVKLPLKR